MCLCSRLFVHVQVKLRRTKGRTANVCCVLCICLCCGWSVPLCLLDSKMHIAPLAVPTLRELQICGLYTWIHDDFWNTMLCSVCVFSTIELWTVADLSLTTKVARQTQFILSGQHRCLSVCLGCRYAIYPSRQRKTVYGRWRCCMWNATVHATIEGDRYIYIWTKRHNYKGKSEMGEHHFSFSILFIIFVLAFLYFFLYFDSILLFLLFASTITQETVYDIWLGSSTLDGWFRIE